MSVSQVPACRAQEALVGRDSKYAARQHSVLGHPLRELFHAVELRCAACFFWLGAEVLQMPGLLLAAAGYAGGNAHPTYERCVRTTGTPNWCRIFNRRRLVPPNLGLRENPTYAGYAAARCR